MTLNQKAAKIKLLISDVDGVLTNGRLYLGQQGVEMMGFHVHDGVGLQMLLRANIDVGLITASGSPIVAKRAEQIGIKHVYLKQFDKMDAFENLLAILQVDEEAVAYIGDDVPDLPLIQRAGLGVAVPNATPMVLEAADWVTTRIGGQGAVRELCDLILKNKQHEQQ